MHPILFTIGDFPVYTYGLTMSLAFVIGFGWVFYEAKRVGEDLDDYYNLCLICLVGGIVGARLLFVITTYQDFVKDPWTIFNLRSGGLVWYGGLITVVLAIWGYTRWKGMSMYKVGDIMLPATVLGLGVGRIGCIMSGCCYGKPSTLPWAIRYPVSPYIPVEISGQRLHPSPLYELIACFIIAGFLGYLQRHKTREGQVTWSFFLLYGIARFILEFWRNDAERGFVIPQTLSTSQAISIPLILLAILMLWRMRNPEEPQA